jgi:hypothetical protein
VGRGTDQRALIIEMFVEDGFHVLVDRGLREINVDFLKSGYSNVVGLEIATQLMEVSEIIREREGVDIIRLYVEAVKVGVQRIAAGLIGSS